MAGDEPLGRRSQANCAGRRGLLHPRGQMHIHPGRVIFDGIPGTDDPHRDFPRVQPDTHLNLRLVAQRADIERGPTGSIGMILLREWGAKQRHYAVAQNARDDAVMLAHRAHHGLQRGVQQHGRLLWIEVVNQCCRFDDIGKQDGNKFPLGFQLDARVADALLQMGRDRGILGSQVGAAGATEAMPGRDSRAAVPAGVHRPAFGPSHPPPREACRCRKPYRRPESTCLPTVARRISLAGTLHFMLPSRIERAAGNYRWV